MKKRVLVLYARYGSGHKSIAEYVYKYINDNNKYDIKLLDITPYANFLGKCSVKVMDFVAKKRPELLFDTCYEIADHKLFSKSQGHFCKKSFDNKELRNAIVSFNPNIVISSHFYCSNIISYYNDLKLINSKIVTIITDYHIHKSWIANHKKEDAFIVGNEIVKKELIDDGVDGKKVYPFGLPLNVGVLTNLDEDSTIFKRYKLNPDKKVYLFFGGSTAGSMYYYEYFKTIAKLNLNANIVFISGKNKKLKDKCDHFVEKHELKNIKVLGFSKDVFNLMKISDLVISKPGGATVTECLEMHCPLLMVPGVGGQEKYNALFIAKKGYGLKVRGTRKFKKVLLKLENNPGYIKRMRSKLEKLDNNNSIIKINDLIKKL